MPDLKSVQFAQEEAQRISQAMEELKVEAKNQIEIEFRGLSMELEQIEKSFSRLYQRYLESAEEEQRAKLRPKLETMLSNKKQSLQRGVRHLDLLAPELLSAFEIDVKGFDHNTTKEKLSLLERRRKEIQGLPVPVLDDEELEERLQDIADRKAKAKESWKGFQESLEAFQEEHDHSLSPPAEEEELAEKQRTLIAKGQEALHHLHLIGGHVKEIRSYLTEEKVEASKVLANQPDLLEEVLADQKEMTTAFMRLLRGGKVELPLPELKDLKTKEQLHTALSGLKDNAVLNEKDYPQPGGTRDHSLFWGYTEILSKSEEVLGAVEKSAEKPNAAQQRLFQLRQSIQSWLALHAKTDIQAQKHGDELDDFAEKLQALLAELQKALLHIGGFMLQKDTFPEVITAYKLADEKLSILETLYERYQEIDGSMASLEEDSEAYKALEEQKGTVTGSFLSQSDEVRSAVETFIQKASDWAVVHESEKEAIGWQRKQEELYQKSQNLYLRSYALDNVPELKFRTFQGLRKVLPQEYNKGKDKLLKQIQSKQKELKKLAKEGGHYSKRFTKLGDLNNAIQEWDFEHRFYREEQLGDSLEEVEAARSYFEEQFELVKAQKSMKALLKGMDKRLKSFVKDIKKLKKKPEKGKQRAKLIFAATELLEFVDLWEQNYQTVKKQLGDEVDKELEEMHEDMQQLRSLIADKGLGLFTQSDAKEGKVLTELEARKTKAADLERKHNELLRQAQEKQHALEQLGPLKEDSSDLERKAYEKAKQELKTLQEAIQSAEEEQAATQDQIENLKEELFGFQKSASKIFTRLYKGYEVLDFEYDAEADSAKMSERWNNLSYLLEQVGAWKKAVVNPEAPNLKSTYEEVKRIEKALLDIREVFLKKGPEKEDELYPRIEKAWQVAVQEGIEKPLAEKDITQQALQQLLYIQKLMRYWHKENPIVSKNKEEQKKRQQLDVWNKKIEAELASGRFGMLKIKAEAEDIIKEAEELRQQLAFDAQDRRQAAEGQQIYNADNPKSFQALLDWCKEASQKAQSWKSMPNSLREEEDAVKMKDLATEWYVEVSEYYRDSQTDLGKALQEVEQLAFVGIGDGDYDYENSGAFSPEHIALMNKMMNQAITRARAILEAGGGYEEARATVAHIPTAVLPDDFIEQLRAFAITDKALRDEQAEQAQEAGAKALGLHDIILDKDLNANMGLVLSRLTKLDSLTTYKQWSDEDDKYQGLYIGTDDTGQAQAHKVVANVGNFLDTAFAGIAAFNDIKDSLSQEKKRKMAADYLFKGSIDFEDVGADVDHVKTSEDKLISDRKRTILLAGMNVVAKISGTIDNTAGTYLKEVAPEFSASLKGVSLFFTEVANLIKGSASPDDIARSTEQLWRDRIGTFETVAKGLLSTGTGIAKVSMLFGEIPAGIVPGLGIATNALSLSINVKGVAEKLVLRHKTKQLQKQAQLVDRSYIGPLQQEITSLNRRITKQSIDAGGDAIAMAGSIVDAAGVTYGIGTAITLVGGALKVANELVFTGINEAQMKKARDLLKKAQGGDRQAKIDIMKQSPIYAKMFIAIGATEDPPNAIAMEFIRQRGITERDIKDAGTSTMVVRRFLRKQLLTKSEEEDSHEGKRMLFKALAAKYRAWRGRAQAKNDFWSGKNKDYATLTSLYAQDKIQKALEADVQFIKSSQSAYLDDMSLLLLDLVKEQIRYLRDIFEKQQLEIRREERGVKEELEAKIEVDKSSKDKDYGPEIARLEQQQAALQEQKQEVADLLGTIQLLD